MHMCIGFPLLVVIDRAVTSRVPSDSLQGMSDLATNWLEIGPKWNPGIFQIRYQYILNRWANENNLPISFAEKNVNVYSIFTNKWHGHGGLLICA